jgi:hypothetical protein
MAGLMAREDVLVWLGFGLVVAASVLSVTAGLFTQPADAPCKISKNLLRRSELGC